MTKRPIQQKAFDVFNVIFMLVIGFAAFYPMWHVLCASFSDSNALMRHEGILLFPLEFSLNAYKKMFTHSLIVSSLKNTLIIAGGAVCVEMFMTILCAYVLSRKGVMLNKFFSVMVVITMFFSGGLIPTYLVVSKTLHLSNTYWALILINAVNVYNMIIMRTSFLSIPSSLEESASIDGANHWVILFRIVVPLSKAIIAVIALYYAVGEWNSWFDASIYLKDRTKYPLQLVLREILIENDTSSMEATEMADVDSVGETIKYATIIFATVPILCIYPYLQKYFTKGVMIGAVKG